MELCTGSYELWRRASSVRSAAIEVACQRVCCGPPSPVYPAVPQLFAAVDKDKALKLGCRSWMCSLLRKSHGKSLPSRIRRYRVACSLRIFLRRESKPVPDQSKRRTIWSCLMLYTPSCCSLSPSTPWPTPGSTQIRTYPQSPSSRNRRLLLSSCPLQFFLHVCQSTPRAPCLPRPLQVRPAKIGATSETFLTPSYWYIDLSRSCHVSGQLRQVF